jgi:hypothetical protein
MPKKPDSLDKKWTSGLSQAACEKINCFRPFRSSFK